MSYSGAEFSDREDTKYMYMYMYMLIASTGNVHED